MKLLIDSDTHLFEVLDRVLPTEDEDISKVVGRGLSRQGIGVHTSTAVENVSSGPSSVTFTAAGEQLEVDWLVLAVGRGPDVAGLGLDEAGVAHAADDEQARGPAAARLGNRAGGDEGALEPAVRVVDARVGLDEVGSP